MRIPAYVVLTLMLIGCALGPARAQTVVTLGGGFAHPYSVAISQSSIYVADSDNGQVKSMAFGCTGAGCVGVVAGGFGFPTGAIVISSSPLALAVADQANNAVGAIVPSVGSVAIGGGFKQPSGVAEDRSGNIYVGDFGNNAVKMIPFNAGSDTFCEATSCVVTLASGLDGPFGVAVDGSGTVFVADRNNNAVEKIASGGFASSIGSGFHFPQGVAVDGDGNVYVGDTGNNAVKKIVAATGGAPVIVTLGSGFNEPNGITLDPAGNVYVADTENNAVKEILTATTVNVGSSPGSSAYGQSVTFTATVVGTGGIAPTGTVQWTDGSTSLVTTDLTPGAGATATTSFATTGLSVGNHAITARYVSNGALSNSSGVVAQAVLSASSTVSLAASANPSAPGQSVTFMANVAAVAPAGGVPTGSVTFLDGGTAIGPVTILNGGVASLATAALAAGSHMITAAYSGDPNFLGSTSVALDQTIGTTGTTASVTTLASSLNPSASGQAVTFTATVTGPGGTPTGSVLFTGLPRGVNASQLSGGVATFTTSALTVGSDPVTAVYNGDANFATSTSAVLNQVVTAGGAAPSITSISPTSGPAAGGTLVTITGTNLTGATAVAFGGKPASAVTVDSATSVTATAPPGVTGSTVDVTVTTTGGASATGSGDKFTYLMAPVTGTNGIYAFASSFGTKGAGNLQFEVPVGIAIDRAGHRLFVADSANARVQVLDSDTLAFIATIGTTGAAGTDNAHLSGPVNVAFDPVSNRVFVADTNNDRVQVFDGTRLAYQATIGVTGVTAADSSHLAAPAELDIDQAGHLLIADSQQDRVQLFGAASLGYVATIGSSGVPGSDNAHLSTPSDVKFDPVTGQIWVADSGNGRIQIFDGATRAFVATVPGPAGGAFSSLILGPGFDPVAGTGVVSDAGNNRVIVYDAATARVLAELGGTGTGNGQFNGPTGVVADPANNRVLIADAANYRLEIFGDIPTPLASAVLPGSRSVETGNPATIFGTMINTAPASLLNCQLGISTALTAQGLTFSYQTTIPATNAPTGTPDTPATIAGNDGIATFLLAFGDTAPVTLPAQALDFSCDGVAPVTPVVGVNTVDLTFSATPIADIIALAATAAPGVVTMPVGGIGAFAVASFNVGVTAPITISADTGSATLPVIATLCQTNPSSGQCLAAASPSVTLDFAANSAPTFSIFLQSSGPIGFAPGASRIFVRFKDAGGGLHGSTSVAVETQ